MMATQLNIPGLQSCNGGCVACGARADLYCARCGITPYCSAHCQRQDWSVRHNRVCHNLVRLNPRREKSPAVEADTSTVSVPTPPPQLRRPRSPNAAQIQAQANGVASVSHENKGGVDKQRAKSSPHMQNTNKTKFVPPGYHPPAPQRAQNEPRAEPRQNQNLQRQESNDDGEWGNGAGNPAPKAEARSQPITEEKASPPKSAFEKPASKYDIPKAKTESPRMAEIPNGQPKPVETHPDVALVPAQYIVDKLSVGEVFVLSVEQDASKCGSVQAGFVCVGMHASCQQDYTKLLAHIFDGDNSIVPKPGTTFAYLDPADEGWYRARCLNNNQCALLDAGRLANIGQGQSRALAADCCEIPEFCCVLNGKVEVGMSLQATLLSKSDAECKVSLTSDEDVFLGEGVVTRWLPRVDDAKPKTTAHLLMERLSTASQITPPRANPTPNQVPEKKTQESGQRPQESAQRPPESAQRPQESAQKPPRIVQQVPQNVPKPKASVPVSDISRPDIVNGGKYVLLHVTSLFRACVRACDEQTTRQFESVLQDVALYGAKDGKPLTDPPSIGQEVLCMYDGVHYRALVTKRKPTGDMFLVQYAEYGNEEKVTLDKLYACPPELSLSSRPARASLVALSATVRELTEDANRYLEGVKEEVELIAAIPTGEKTAPSGSLVQFSVAKNKENINKKLEQMCTPEWKKLEMAQGDVIASDVVLINDMKILPLPTNRPFVLRVTDINSLKCGVLSGYEDGAALAPLVYGSLTDKINEYCNSSLCKDPYLPAVGEVCFAKMAPYPQWFRAVVISHTAGAVTASVLYLDYGNVSAEVPVQDLRKCMPEFTEQPALAALIVIQDWPGTVTDEQLLKALEYLQIDDEGTGTLQVKKCVKSEEETYTIVHPELLAAINV